MLGKYKLNMLVEAMLTTEQLYISSSGPSSHTAPHSLGPTRNHLRPDTLEATAENFCHNVSDKGLLVNDFPHGCLKGRRLDADRVESLEVLQLRHIAAIRQVKHAKHDLDVFL